MLRVGFLTHGTGLRSLSESERYAYGWICERPGIAVRLLTATQAGGEAVDVLWWHAARALPPEAAILRTVAGALREAVTGAVPILLTGTALAALPPLELEDEPPRTSDGSPYEGPVGEHEIRGHITFAGHPAFIAFGTGAYTWKPAAGVPVWDAWYERGEYEPRGRTVCVERRHIGLDPTRLTGLSYETEHSRVGALGAHLPFHDRTNPYRGHLELLLEGWLRWLAGTAGSGPFIYGGFAPELRDRSWPRPGSGVSEEPPDPACAGEGLPLPLTAPPAEMFDELWEEPSPTGYEGVEEEPADTFFEVTGHRHFIMGHARSGPAEAWTGGVRLFRRLALSWSEPEGRRVLLDDPRTPFCRRAVARPDGWRRELAVPVPGTGPAGGEGGGGEPAGEVRLRQIVAAHPDLGAGYSLIGVESAAGGTFSLEAIADLRLQWPLPAGIAGPLALSRPADGMVVVRGAEREVCGIFTLAGPGGPGRWSAGESTAPDPSEEEGIGAVRLLGEVAVPAGKHVLLLAWAASASGPRGLSRALAAILEDPGRVFRLGHLRLRRQTADRVRLETPGRRFGEAFNRTAAGLGPFLFTSDRLGTSLLAGFNVTGRGWLSGRPGYAWFFGRDAVFTALGMLAAGEREGAEAVLRFLAAHQEWTGKILHEATLSGAVHYDAADSTPLWLILLGAWYRTTGDTGLLRELWPAARRALSFCRRTDTDRDGLIENTGVGHGWIEGGSLYGAHVTHYLAGVWAAAAEAAADCAEALGETAEAAEARRDAERARAALETVFWLDEETGGTGSTGHYALGLKLDRTLQTDLTVMPTVPILLGQTDPERGRAHLVPLAGEEYSADWGVRLVGRSHRFFDPRGYHHGSIWPLYTGWTAQAEYRVHRHEAGLAHLMAGLATVFDPPAGSVEEVLHGLRYEPAGVCPHQAWSHAAVVQAVIDGLIGWRPDARGRGGGVLAPHLPEDWEALSCRGLRVGGRRLAVRVDGEPGRRTWRLELSGDDSRPFDLRFSPALPFEARLERLSIDGQAEHAVVSDTADDQHLEIDLMLTPGRPVEIEIAYVFDLVPVIPEPELEPGAPARSWRLVDRWWEGGGGSTAAPPETCRLFLEGPPGSTAEIACLLPGRRPKEVQGARWAEPPRRGRGRLLVTFPESPGRVSGDDRYTAAVVQVSFA